jgi:hypothetical protein
MSLAVALPATAEKSLGPVHLIQLDVKGPTVAALRQAPKNLNTEDFLEKYQKYSQKASDFIGSKNLDSFPSAGTCFAEYPCFSIGKPGVAKIGDKPELSQDQFDGLAREILSVPQITFDQSNHDTVLNGLKKTYHGAVLEVVAPPGTMSSEVLIGMAFDMFKVQSGSTSTNSVRATQAATDGQQEPLLAMCLYPEGIDNNVAQNFCTGKELDGSPMAKATRPLDKRFSLDGILTGFCQLVDIPLLCEKSG